VTSSKYFTSATELLCADFNLDHPGIQDLNLPLLLLLTATALDHHGGWAGISAAKVL